MLSPAKEVLHNTENLHSALKYISLSFGFVFLRLCVYPWRWFKVNLADYMFIYSKVKLDYKHYYFKATLKQKATYFGRYIIGIP